MFIEYKLRRYIQWGLFWVYIIHGIFDFGELLGANMGIDFGGFQAGVAQYFLDVAEVDTLFQKVCGETMTQGMWGGVFLDIGFFKGFAEYVFDTGGAVGSPSLALEQPGAWFVWPVIISQKKD